MDKRFIGLGLTALRNNFAALKRPYKLTFSVTYRCQSRCLTCNIWQLKPAGELSLDEIGEFARKNPHFRWIEITGGEPFLRSDIVDIVRAFSEHSDGLYLLTMPTNSLINKDLLLRNISAMLELGIPKISITISLDGYRELHDRIRGIPGNFDRAIALYKGIAELRKEHRNLFSVFGYTMSRYNAGMFVKTYEEVKKEIPEIRYNDFHINAAQTSEIYYKNSGMDIRSENRAMADEIRSILKRRSFEIGAIPQIESVFLRKLVRYLMTNRSPMRSRSLDASLFLDSYGNVYPSIMWSRKIGNIREAQYSLDGIWENEEAGEVRRLIREGREPSCWTACEAYQSIVGNIKSLLV